MKIAAACNDVIDRTDRLLEIVSDLLENVSNLRQSILAAAFQGELAP